MRGRSYTPSPQREYGRRGRSPSPRGRHDRGDAPTSLLVRNLRRDCRPEDLRSELRGFGFVQYVDPADAAEAKYEMDGHLFQGAMFMIEGDHLHATCIRLGVLHPHLHTMEGLYLVVVTTTLLGENIQGPIRPEREGEAGQVGAILQLWYKAQAAARVPILQSMQGIPEGIGHEANE